MHCQDHPDQEDIKPPAMCLLTPLAYIDPLHNISFSQQQRCKEDSVVDKKMCLFHNQLSLLELVSWNDSKENT